MYDLESIIPLALVVGVLMGAGRGQSTAGPANGMTFQFTSGDIESGEIRMYGLKTA